MVRTPVADLENSPEPPGGAGTTGASTTSPDLKDALGSQGMRWHRYDHRRDEQGWEIFLQRGDPLASPAFAQ